MRQPPETRRLIAVDLDGTLLDAHGRPHQEDVRALRLAADAGVTVTIATGRLYSGTRAAAEALGLSGPVACADGSHVVHTGTHTTLMHRGMTGAPAGMLRDSLARHGPTSFVFAYDAIIHDDAGESYLGYVTTWSNDIRRTATLFEHESWQNAEGITAVVALGSVNQISSTVEDIQRDMAESIQVAMFPIRRVPGVWGLIARAIGGTKGSALEWLAEHHGVPIEGTICVGDWLNDVSMFAVAGRSFAMGQAPDEVKQAASDVLEETSETGGGIARVVADVLGLRP